ncbi:NAD(P)-dependent oxidoreductase [Algihabitans albus]|uniref:NAD(P)-dependent oxidoreductase n=1 Tax=Algihabitans albus TaxID=2164067 RepID=UPI000E5CADDC|nr:NAD(P)-dependent oxidoreductase [Algihabitans albus]
MAQAIRKVGVVGLGNMGLPMARTLETAGFAVAGFDAAEARREAFSPTRDSLTELAADSDALLLSLPTSQIVEAVVAEAAPALPPGSLVIDTSTAEPGSTRRLQAEMAARGLGYVDAPVSGGPSGARNAQLLIMAGGNRPDLDRAEALLATLSRQVVRCGGPGAGNVTKLVNNLLCAAHLTLAGEALALAEAGGLTPEALLAALNIGSGRSGVTEVNLPRWVLSGDFDSGFSMGLMRKDVGLALKLAEEAEVTPALAGAAAAIWQESRESLPDSEDFNRMVTYAKESSRG